MHDDVIVLVAMLGAILLIYVLLGWLADDYDARDDRARNHVRRPRHDR